MRAESNIWKLVLVAQATVLTAGIVVSAANAVVELQERQYAAIESLRSGLAFGVQQSNELAARAEVYTAQVALAVALHAPEETSFAFSLATGKEVSDVRLERATATLTRKGKRSW